MPSVLVVDDIQLIRELFSAWLEKNGHSVMQAASAREAQSLLTEHKFDVVLSDIRMTQVSGIDLLAWIRSTHEFLPVILITGAPAVDTAISALRLQAYDYLLKPVEEAHLISVIERAAAHHQLLRDRRRLEQENHRYQLNLETQVAQKTAELRRLNNQLLSVHQLVRAVNQLEDFNSVCEHVVAAIRDNLGYEMVGIIDINRDFNNSDIIALAGCDADAAPDVLNHFLKLDRVTETVRKQTFFIVNDTAAEAGWGDLPHQCLGSVGLFPIHTHDTKTTVLIVAESSANAYDETDQLVLSTLSDHIGVTLNNALLYSRVNVTLNIREQVLQNISHELRTPLTIIHGYAEMLADDGEAVPEAFRQGLDVILEQARHLHHLVDQLITFQEISLGDIAMMDIQLVPWVERVASAWLPILEERRQTLTTAFAPEIDTIQGDRNYLTQVLNNLIGNASKFSPADSTIRIQVRQDEHEVLVSVSDSGIGVAPEKLPHLFDRFYQAESGSTRRFPGMGLGLSLAKEIVGRHGGRIWVESQGAERGTTVTFALPCGRPR